MKKLVISTFIVLIASLSLSAESLMRTIPFLQNPTNGGVTITWLTNSPSFSYVEYGTSPDKLERAVTMVDGQIIAGNKIHRIRLESIKPGVKYYYRAVSKEITKYEGYKKEFGDSVATEFFQFEIPAVGDNYKVAVFNDLHNHKETVDTLESQIADSGYNLAIFNGDCIADPANEDVAVSIISHIAKVVGKGTTPLVFIRGNHEIRNAYSIRLREIIEYSTEKSYGGFSWSNSRFMILDCGEDKPDSHWVYYGLNNFEGFRKEQVDFIKREIKSKEFKKAQNRVLIHHIPIYYPENTVLEIYNPCYDLWNPILKSVNFDICLNGHTHIYAHYKKGELGDNNFPIFHGGGYEFSDAAVILINKSGKILKTQLITAEGKVVAEEIVEN